MRETGFTAVAERKVDGGTRQHDVVELMTSAIVISHDGCCDGLLNRP